MAAVLVQVARWRRRPGGQQLDLEGDLEPELLVGQIEAHQRRTGLGMRGCSAGRPSSEIARGDQARRPAGAVGP